MACRLSRCLLALLASTSALVVPPARLKTRRSVAPAQRPPAPLADAPRLPATATLAARSAAAPTEYVVYESRWAHLFMLSLLAFVSDLVCFATASDPAAFNVATGEDAAQVIDVFLFANVFSCFFFTDVSRALVGQMQGQGHCCSAACLAHVWGLGVALCESLEDKGVASKIAKAVDTQLASVLAPRIEAYDERTAKDLVSLIRDIEEPARLRRIGRYEAAHKARKTVLGAVEKQLGRLEPKVVELEKWELAAGEEPAVA